MVEGGTVVEAAAVVVTEVEEVMEGDTIQEVMIKVVEVAVGGN